MTYTTNNLKAYRCFICKETFRLKESLHQHLSKEHRGEKEKWEMIMNQQKKL
jgi:hypothetical protein